MQSCKWSAMQNTKLNQARTVKELRWSGPSSIDKTPRLSRALPSKSSRESDWLSRAFSITWRLVRLTPRPLRLQWPASFNTRLVHFPWGGPKWSNTSMFQMRRSSTIRQKSRTNSSQKYRLSDIPEYLAGYIRRQKDGFEVVKYHKVFRWVGYPRLPKSLPLVGDQAIREQRSSPSHYTADAQVKR